MTTASRTNSVRDHRKAARLTQAELGKACGVSRQSIVSVEGGDYAPSVYLALKLARALGTTVETLFDLEES
ncbi:helix-turn-helix transcriptional regulator [Rhodococcus sp. BP-252]|uniref:Transcriptional regulator n=1 Tax=Rhodococcoides kyotonense TaxID=398843 RepID=A0A177Y9P3_9NOCA|nr:MULTISPECIES: helix-turn-helix transcriptional regulator [Rhodococcus]MBY6413706.1 helix-turn-helix transcriptional regulator [Rhodococcus sp. BP-320]MBY6418307.1 helix-turn-helix transcriptional regulator [Rhodococcus sp. BP-321]MBY6422432.1 helix-turn-helix transcriptional regulator [Rhodococcus sp. BP-324]MBY6428252.1 helix-turn-helix transcriptional regulator [Rhodococcus sp. BP-323]MBY6433429.1 helix-turn-helix transcriptional regulator [Rhodococcus sp. BP-322]